jgi:hypothetical protein
MTNVCVSSPIIAFHDENIIPDEVSLARCPDDLRRREKAERAAAKNSATLAGRRAHQELAQLLYIARKEIEAAHRSKGESRHD